MTTNNAINSGNGITGQVMQAVTGAAPAYSTATYPSTTTINQILFSSAANTVTGLATANSATLVTSSAGIPSLLALSGQQSLVGVTSGTPAAAYIPGRNMIVNGDFRVWQRGAGGVGAIAVPASTTQYTADRWQLATGANQACTVSQASFYTAGDFAASVQRNAGQTGTGVLRFCTSLTTDMCDSPGNFNGGKVTLSFKAVAGANFSPTGGNITVTVYSGTGTNKSGINGAFTGSTAVISQTQAITASVVNYSFTSSALAANVTQLAVEFSWTPTGTAGVADTVSFTDVQLELSPVQTPFDRKNFNKTLLECQRFYCKSFNYATAPAQNTGAGTGEQVFIASTAAATTNRSPTVIFPVMMLAAPTVTTYSPGAASAQVYDITASAVCTATTLVNTTARGFYLSCTGNAGTAIGNALGFHWQADADLV